MFRSEAKRLARRLGFPGPVPCPELGRPAGREVALLGLAACGKEVLTGGGTMVFLSFEDEFSLFETVLFPAVLSRYRRSIQRGGVMLLCGRVEKEMGAVTVTVRRLVRLAQTPRSAKAQTPRSAKAQTPRSAKAPADLA